MAIVLLVLFAVPSFVPALHELIEDHEHLTCTAKDVKHLHDSEEECVLCDYLISFNPYPNDYTELVSTFPPSDVEFALPAPVSIRNILNANTLRGPPAIC